LEKVKKGLTTKWKAIYENNNEGKTKSDDGNEEALSINTKKNTFQSSVNPQLPPSQYLHQYIIIAGAQSDGSGVNRSNSNNNNNNTIVLRCF
jgi:hypothetical protein